MENPYYNHELIMYLSQLKYDLNACAAKHKHLAEYILKLAGDESTIPLKEVVLIKEGEQ